MKTFLAWWTADHVQAVKKAFVMAAGLAVYFLPKGSTWGEVAALVAAGGLTDSTLGSIWKLLQGGAQ
jgi:predicted dienelactone hydrolase